MMKKERKSRKLSIRVTEGQYFYLNELSKVLGSSISEIIRNRVFKEVNNGK